MVGRNGSGGEARRLGGDLGVLEDGQEGGRCLLGERVTGRIVVGTGGEGVAAVFKHALGEVGRHGVGLDAKVAEHGVGFPAAEELNGVLVDAGAEEGGSSTGAEAASAEEPGGDAGLWCDMGGSVAKRVGDDGGFEHFEVSVGVAVGAQGCIFRSVEVA